MRLRSLSLVAVMAMIVVSCGGGAPEAAGPSEGIQVHGDWTIDIYNEDGALDEHIEFSNDLVFSGRLLLAELLANFRTTDSWAVELEHGGSADLDIDSPCGVAGSSEPCIVSLDPVLPGDGRFVLEGSFIAEIDGFIGLATTRSTACIVADPTACEPFAFTRAAVADDDGAAHRVDAGQQVEVQVEVSFTSG